MTRRLVRRFSHVVEIRVSYSESSAYGTALIYHRDAEAYLSMSRDENNRAIANDRDYRECDASERIVSPHSSSRP